MLTEQLGASITEAFARLRAYAYRQDKRLSDIAHDIVTRRLRLDPDPPGWNETSHPAPANGAALGKINGDGSGTALRHLRRSGRHHGRRLRRHRLPASALRPQRAATRRVGGRGDAR